MSIQSSLITVSSVQNGLGQAGALKCKQWKI